MDDEPESTPLDILLEIATLRSVVRVLWNALPVDIAVSLTETNPSIVDYCRKLTE